MRVFIGVALLALCEPALAQDYLPGNVPRPWVGPNRLYAVEIPQGWQVYLDEKEPAAFEMRPTDNAGDAALFMRRMTVPKGAHPRQLLLNAIEQRLAKLPSWREAGRRDAKLAGGRAAAVAGAYYHQGNAQYPRAIEEVFIVRDGEAYVFHFECFEPMSPAFAGDLDKVYKSFFPHPPADYGDVRAPDPLRIEPIVNTDKVAY